ncbi:DEAD-box ATP-dependent RNA helicase 46 [Apostasia shenzhenica]|uniref:RNA helicase n=1 Tax=Apostasia shenzhenica TaxID=1088818 RepID=A0A2I0AMD0_9ASPA|nr:DEAD-box ATP-dependent RNA helicase 46 [Apostasia shenzhenica]
MTASAATADSSTSAKARIRYAPADPSLPKPWRGLVDSTTGYLFFWNPETNVTQYERPIPSSPSPPTEQLEVSVSLPTDHDDHSHDREEQQEHQTSGSANVGHEPSDMPKFQASEDSRVVLSAESFRRHHEITVIIHQAGFSAPTPIQAQSWPIALQGRDIVAVAKTGSGKTLGYLIPGFMHQKCLNKDPRMGPTVLVLSPTRELATQIHDEAVKFGRSSKISCTCLYGGAPKGPQLRELDRGVNVVVATPGRLNDILEMRRINLDQVSYLVLDEADRMLDMGFEPQIRKIVKEIPSRRQTLMYTATWPREVRKIAADLLANPVQVNIGNIDELVANKAITQHVEVISHKDKRRRLEQILLSNGPSKYIVFCSTKRMCDQLADFLDRAFGASAIHGDKSQMERDRVLSDFRSGKSPILVATDVAARGLDIKDIRFVINYDFPTGVEDYVHRIGRTGRAGATGVAYTFFCDQDSKHASDLVKVLVGADQKVPSELREMASRSSYGAKFRRWGTTSSYEHGDQGLSQDSYCHGSQDQVSNPACQNVSGYRGSGSNNNTGCYYTFSPGPDNGDVDEGGDDGGRSRSRSCSPR